MTISSRFCSSDFINPFFIPSIEHFTLVNSCLSWVLSSNSRNSDELTHFGPNCGSLWQCPVWLSAGLPSWDFSYFVLPTRFQKVSLPLPCFSVKSPLLLPFPFHLSTTDLFSLFSRCAFKFNWRWTSQLHFATKAALRKWEGWRFLWGAKEWMIIICTAKGSSNLRGGIARFAILNNCPFGMQSEWDRV